MQGNGIGRRGGKGGNGEPTKLEATIHNAQPIYVMLDGRPILKMVPRQTLKASDTIA
jgi:hypothetical protein